MNILAINGSPRGSAGNTEILMRAFLEGAAQPDDTVETVYLKEKRIEHCTGCFTCWFKTPGLCIHNDDMPELLQKLRHAEIIVFGSPLYIYNFTGLMKDFADRLITLAQPFIEIKDGICTHPSRYPDFKPKAGVLISNSGFPEQSHFSGMKEVFRQSFGGGNTICCAGGVLLSMPGMGDSLNWYLDAVRKAGSEVALEGVIRPDTLAILEKPLVEDAVAYAEKANEHWREMGLLPIQQ
ncbi:MAG TPA: flavodoxin family protein [Armatimonadota bacterium]